MKTVSRLIMAVFAMLAANTVIAQEQKEHNDEKHGASANEHMHQSSVEDLINHFESPERDAYQQPEKVLQYLGDVKGKTIMDIGAGSGYFSVKLANAGARVIAGDVDDEFQKHLRNRIEREHLENVELRRLPYDSPALENDEVDMVFMVNTYHHIDNRPDYFAKVKQGLKKGGKLVIIDFFKADLPVGPPIDHKVTMDEVIVELKEAGYTVFDVEVNLLPYQFIVKAG
ncbi:methyltransferase domain-containing protein [Parapedobacter sp. ISTM3]|uniref:class I SAM-dependent methyltransferase n=1 Tax=Parapedobacter sp. ISTM3 TaxID=2800130 RepID=UPI0019076535|nr:methyltransferase domain-containing protein [Parapedobacter sp. ISTM3]MBK1439892.1 methyltransferase domain-containing protein [Parapedobacter sp. ISTM3]